MVKEGINVVCSNIDLIENEMFLTLCMLCVFVYKSVLICLDTVLCLSMAYFWFQSEVFTNVSLEVCPCFVELMSPKPDFGTPADN